MPPSNPDPPPQPPPTTSAQEIASRDGPEHPEHSESWDLFHQQDHQQHQPSEAANAVPDINQPSTATDDPSQSTSITDDAVETPEQTESEQTTAYQQNPDNTTSAMDTDSPGNFTDGNGTSNVTSASVEEEQEPGSSQDQDVSDEHDDEPPYWADFEEDMSAPDDEELAEIESGNGDHSAYEYDFWEESCFKPLDDPEYRPTEKARVTWKIKGVRGTPEKPNRSLIIRSPAAYVGGYYWSLKFFPRGNSVSSLSLYVECSPTPPEPDAQDLDTEFKVVKGPPDGSLNGIKPDVDLTLPATHKKRKRKQTRAPVPGQAPDARHQSGQAQGGASGTTSADPAATCEDHWRVSAEVGVVLYNPNEPRTGHFHSACHQFNDHSIDWGWTRFHGPWDRIHCRQRGQRQALLRNDTLAFDVYIRIIDDPTRSLWWHPSDTEPVWDSLRVTGYKPIGDESNNYSHQVAGLVAWLKIAPVRQLIQSIDILEHLRSPDVKPRSLSNALQRFLFSLRNEPLGLQLYTSTEAVTVTLRNLWESSRDPVGFWEILRRNLELDETDAEEKLSKIFDSQPGDAANEVNCLPREYNSRIVLPADKTKSVQLGMTNYLGGKHGKWSLPPVLQVELARQIFDKSSNQWKMLLDRVHLDEDLDLSNFVPQDQDGKYSLYGLIIHKGHRTSGQFYSILRPEGPGSPWVAFEDAGDRKVTFLTRKAAIENHEGLDSPKNVNEKNSCDVAVVVLYIRHDAVADYLPKQMEPWQMSKLRGHYFKDVNPSLKIALEELSRETVQVELYNLSNPSAIRNSVFDAYDLMSASRAAGECCILNLSPDTTFADMRKQYARWASANAKTKEIDPEEIRFWKIGVRRTNLPNSLHFETIRDLNFKLSAFEMGILRLWVHFLSEDEAEYFAQLDPDPPREPERQASNIADGAQQQNSASVSVPVADDDVTMTDDDNTPADEAQAQDEAAPQQDGEDSAEVQPPSAPEGGESQQQATMMNGVSSADEAAIAAVIADDVEELDRTEEVNPEQASSPQVDADGGTVADHQSARGDVVMEDFHAEGANDQARGRYGGNETDSSEDEMDEDAEVTEAPSRRPKLINLSSQIYYCVQVFDEEKQELRFAGSFLGRRTDGAKLSILEALGYPPGGNYRVWVRLERPFVVSVSGTEPFEQIIPYTRDGYCFIVGKDLTSTQRTKLEEAGLFPNPNMLVQYHWALSRRHPVNSFTGHKTVEASYGGHYYSGDLKNGQWHGKGTHILETGATYVGEFVLGQRQGKGSTVYASGDTYEGDWFQDQRHGHGTFVERKTGNKYVGGYRAGKRHGKGISYWEVADEEMGLCQICYTEEQDALFYPCGHVCACVECANQVDVCPMCRQKSINVVKIYKS